MQVDTDTKYLLNFYPLFPFSDCRLSFSFLCPSPWASPSPSHSLSFLLTVAILLIPFADSRRSPVELITRSPSLIKASSSPGGLLTPANAAIAADGPLPLNFWVFLVFMFLSDISSDSEKPTRIESVNTVKFTSIAAGYYHSMAIDCMRSAPPS